MRESFPGRTLLEWAALLVPPSRREGWRKEWEAEASHAWRVALRDGAGPWRALRLRMRVATCFVDALWVRRETMGMRGWGKELKIALRGLARHRMFTFVTVLTLALGIGANTAVFTLVDGVMLSPLPFDRRARGHRAPGP